MSLCHPIDFIRSSFSPYYCRSFDPKWATASTDKLNVERNCLVQVSNRSRSSKRSYSPQPLWRLILPLASFGVTGWLTEFWFQFNSQRHWQSLAFRTGCLTYRFNSISIQHWFRLASFGLAVQHWQFNIDFAWQSVTEPVGDDYGGNESWHWASTTRTAIAGLLGLGATSRGWTNCHFGRCLDSPTGSQSWRWVLGEPISVSHGSGLECCHHTANARLAQLFGSLGHSSEQCISVLLVYLRCHCLSGVAGHCFGHKLCDRPLRPTQPTWQSWQLCLDTWLHVHSRAHRRLQPSRGRDATDAPGHGSSAQLHSTPESTPDKSDDRGGESLARSGPKPWLGWRLKPGLTDENEPCRSCQVTSCHHHTDTVNLSLLYSVKSHISLIIIIDLNESISADVIMPGACHQSVFNA